MSLYDIKKNFRENIKIHIVNYECNIIKRIVKPLDVQSTCLLHAMFLLLMIEKLKNSILEIL